MGPSAIKCDGLSLSFLFMFFISPSPWHEIISSAPWVIMASDRQDEVWVAHARSLSLVRAHTHTHTHITVVLNGSSSSRHRGSKKLSQFVLQS